MKKTLKTLAASLLAIPVLALGVGVSPLLTSSAAAETTTPDCSTGVPGGLGAGAKCAQGQGQQTQLFGDGGIFTTVVNVLLYIIGAIAVIMLIIGGIRYVVSSGESGAVQSAKNTILYAVIGIIVAILAYAIVNFVIGNFVASS